ncbi:MAG: TonB-dependent receptor [Chlorobiaceae bacterium]|nr:TonB-dependent receptor [Chlorobiaceae bacterium]
MKAKHAHLYRAFRFVFSALCLMTMLVPLPSYGADTGTVKGKITDKADGEGVFGASVQVAGTTLGTATDMNGNFTLQNVPAKQQKISVSIVGYTPASQIVTVNPGQTASLNITIGQTTIMASEVVVGAALYKQDRLEVPVTTNVVSREKIRQAPNPTLDKVIEDVPGVVVNRAGGVATSTIQIRGSNTFQGGGIGTRVQCLYDGFPINSPESGEIVWQTVNMNAADKVEVMKGAAATLYGSGAMGGVVNVFGHLPETFEVKAGASVGFYDAPPSSDKSEYRKDYTPWMWNSYVGIGNKSGKWQYSTLYSHASDDGYRQNAENYMNDIKLKARYEIDSRQYIQLTAFYDQTIGGYAYQWPFNTDVSMFGPPPPTITFTPIPNRSFDVYRTFTSSTGLVPAFYSPLYDVYKDDRIKRSNALVGFNYVNMISDRLSVDSKLYYTFNSSRIDYNLTSAPQMYPTGGGFLPYPFNGPGYPSMRVPGQFNDTDANRYGAGVKLDWRATDNHRLLFGVDGNIVNVSTTQVAAEFPVTNIFHDIQEKNFSVFLQDEWKLSDRITALLSARYDWSGINADRAETSPGTWINLNNKSVDAISPRVALNYKATDDMSFRASWGRSFRAPTLYERFVREGGIFIGAPNPDLTKETMTAYEIGMFKQFGDKVSFDIAGFINDYDNLIQSIIDTKTNTFMYRNVTKARIWGIETSLNIRPSSHWSMNLGYTYLNAQNTSYVKGQDATLDNNPDPKWLPYRPEHTASASITWKPVSKLSMNVGGRYVGKYKAVSVYTNPQGKYYPGDFIIFDAGLKYQPVKEVTFSLLCKNIGNVLYEESEWFRAPNRSYVAGVDFTF